MSAIDNARAALARGNNNHGHIEIDAETLRELIAGKAPAAQIVRDYWDACGDLIDSHNGARLAFEEVIARIEESGS